MKGEGQKMRGKGLFISMVILLLTGCISGQRAGTMEYYMLDYSPPSIKETACLDEVIKIERFSVAQLFNSNAMLYRTGPFGLSNFPSERWRTNPGNMVTDYLIRDVRHAGLFRAVFSYRDAEASRFVIEGSVMEFLEVQQEGSRKALLTISVTLFDLSQTEITKKVVFQKRYSHASACKEKGPAGLARGLSESMELLAGQIVGDVYHAVKFLKSVPGG
jgi:ABC-type uncharacterized transport system auxiliary subunit